MIKFKSILFLAVISVVLCYTGCKNGSDSDSVFDDVNLSDDIPTSGSAEGVTSSLAEINARDIKAMKTGWNLGNTLDAHDATNFSDSGLITETCWGQPKTTESMIKGLAKSGIKTIRIPVSWSAHIDDNYKLDAAWLARVKTIVDWCIKNNMYVILNTHHDNFTSSNITRACQGYYPSSAAYQKSKKFVESVWSQVAAYFKEYNGVLIFETLNEPRLRNHACEWTYNGCNDCRDAMICINSLNQVAVNAIRAAGGGNATRMIMIPSYVASPDAAMNGTFKMPSDSANNLALSVHMYTPYSFAMQYPGDKEFLDWHKDQLNNYFSRLSSKGAVIIGEYGCSNKYDTADFKKHRINWFKYFLTKSYSRGIVSVLWDNGNRTNPGEPNEAFGFYNRSSCSWYDNDILSAIMDSVE